VMRAADASADEPRLWPLGITINLTSSFGEYRSGHLHAGLDIKTHGKEGVPCRAVVMATCPECVRRQLDMAKRYI
jgi:hypothetical protein